MITSTKYRSGLYEDLFQKANERLSSLEKTDFDKDTLPIESLEEYFANLRTLVYGDDETINDKNIEDLQKRFVFLKLPLDEPPIWIDANSRLISKKIEEDGYGLWENGVYKELKKGSNHPFFTNGIAVQGDEVAEIIYFEIDRFFDATDLSLMDIAVQWIHENDIKNGVEPIYNYTPIIIKDIESNPGKLLFGWPINSDVTSIPGKINFSIRFYHIEGTSIVYSFTTQSSTLTVNSTILANVDTGLGAIDNSAALILGRLQNSIFGGYGDPEMPIFVLMNPNENNNIIDDIYNFNTDLYVLYQVGKGQLGYQWGYSDNENKFTSISGEFTSLGIDSQDNGGIVGFLEVDNFITNLHRYYIYNIETEIYESINLDSEDEFNKAKMDNDGVNHSIYVRCATLRITKPEVKEQLHSGNLEINVQNKYYDKTISLSKEDRKYWIIASPEEIDLENDLATLQETYELNDDLKNIVLQVNNTDTINQYTICQWNGKDLSIEDGNKIICPVNEEDVYTLTLQNKKNNTFSNLKEVKTFIYNKIPTINLEVDDIVAKEENGNVIIYFNGNLPEIKNSEISIQVTASKIEGFPESIGIEKDSDQNQIIVKGVSLASDNNDTIGKLSIAYDFIIEKKNPNKDDNDPNKIVETVTSSIEKTVRIK